MHLANPKTLITNERPIRCARPAIFAFALVVLCSVTLQAATVTEYRERLKSSVVMLKGLAAQKTPAESAVDSSGMTAVFEGVRSLVPASESVEADGRSMQVDNEWLHLALTDCEKTPAGPIRTEKISRVAEQLEALDVRLNEFESAASTDGRGKEQNKARLEEILRRSEYQKKAAEGGALARFWQRLLRWLNSLLPESKPLAPSPTGAAVITQLAQVFVVTLALLVIAYVVWKLAPRFFRSRKAAKKSKREARIVLGETLDPDQSAGDLLSDAEALARAGDLRAAIRKAYIALLCELGDRKIIRLAQHKTNRDYLSSVREIPPLHEEMGKLTRSFESHWYGFMPATETEWASFRDGYHRAVSLQQ